MRRLAVFLATAAAVATGLSTASARTSAPCVVKSFRLPVASDARHPAAIGTAAVSTARDAWASGYSTNPVTARRQELMLHWTGSGWRVVPTPDPTHDFVGWVATRSEKDWSEVWAVGSGRGGALTMRWNGRKWVVVPAPRPSRSSLTDVTIAGKDDVWATGTAQNGPYVMHWDGARWAVVTAPDFGQGSFASVARIPGTGQVWVYGDDEASYSVASARSTADGGWEKLALPVKGAGWSTTSRSLVADTATSAWIAMTVNNDAGVNDPFMLRWNGTAWKRVSTGKTSGSSSLVGIAAAKKDDVWAVGVSLTTGSSGRTKRSFVLHWNGVKWQMVGGYSHAAVVQGGVPAGLGGIAATTGSGPVWAFGTTLDEYVCS